MLRHAALLQFRSADASDADAIGALHSESWRRHYRGAYSDAYLDGDVRADRSALWHDRLRRPGDGSITIVAELDRALVGFAHTIFDTEPVGDAFLDNLHVAHALQGRGIGAHLLALSARATVDRTPSAGLYLWVLEQNVNAQAFYSSLEGRPVERAQAQAPGGDPARLNGTPVKLRYVWADPATLIRND
jgi:ribosomal protein S18 acetylase RimI-like enzyme